VEQGSETRTIGYLQQFVARAENRIRRDEETRDALVAAARELIADLEQEEQVEARPPLSRASGS
jgi:anti-sigma-K factor RskA